MKPLAYEDAMRVLLEGTCGANSHLIYRETGVAQHTVRRFLSRDHQIRHEGLEALGWFLWRRLNAHLLLGPEDRRP